MNNLNESAYALRNLWSKIKKLIKKSNLKYMTMPVIYLLIVLTMSESVTKIVNEVTYLKSDSYVVKPISNDEKVNYILDKYNLSENEFNVLVAIVLSECEYNSYEDSYAVINTIYNRTHSKNWVRSANNRFGDKKGENLYYQAILPNQFVVYEHGSYKNKLNIKDGVGYNAIIDFLYTENILHDYLSFRSHNSKVNGSESFSDKGNKYFNKIKDINRI